MDVIREPRFAAAAEDKAKVFEFSIPLPNFVAVSRLRLRRRRPDPEGVPRGHVEECRAYERDVQPQPAPEECGCHVVTQLRILTGLDQRHGFGREHIARDNEEDGYGEVAAGEKGSDAVKAREVIPFLVAECVFEYGIFARRIVSPQLVMVPVHQEGCESSETIQPCRASERSVWGVGPLEQQRAEEI